MNTSLGNGFVNLMLFLYLMKEKGNTNFECVVEGDDLACSFIGELPTEQDYADLGFTIKIEARKSLAELSFCGLVFDPKELVSITDPIKVILNLPWTNRKFVNAGKRLRRRLLKSKAMSAYYQYRGVPIVQSFAMMILRLLKDERMDHRMMNSYWHKQILEGMKSKMPEPIPVGIKTRELMQRCFDISIQDQIELENYFDSMKELSPWSHHVILDHCKKTAHKDFPKDVQYSFVDVWEMYVSTDKNPILMVPINFSYSTDLLPTSNLLNAREQKKTKPKTGSRDSP